MRRLPASSPIGLLAALVLAALVLAGCVPASPDVTTYDGKATLTLQSGVSESRTVEKVLRSLYDGRMLRPTAKTQLRYSEDGLGTATQAFTELNPPPSRDWLSRRVGTLLSDASDLVEEARIAVEREHAGRYPGIAKDLEEVAATMEKLEGRLS